MDDRSGANSQVSWSVSLVIPAYNEEAGIRQAIEEADNALATLASDYEVLVVDDGSHDGTAAIVGDAAQQRPHVKLLRSALVLKRRAATGSRLLTQIASFTWPTLPLCSR
jgi:cellulose synthase/poly-beta-1,6-N-acetylglucosamine synthase-like glycosyltransferase